MLQDRNMLNQLETTMNAARAVVSTISTYSSSASIDPNIEKMNDLLFDCNNALFNTDRLFSKLLFFKEEGSQVTDSSIVSEDDSMSANLSELYLDPAAPKELIVLRRPDTRISKGIRKTSYLRSLKSTRSQQSKETKTKGIIKNFKLRNLKTIKSHSVQDKLTVASNKFGTKSVTF